MTRTQIKNKIISIMGHTLEATAADDTNLYIIDETIEEAAEQIMKLWDKGFAYELELS